MPQRSPPSPKTYAYFDRKEQTLIRLPLVAAVAQLPITAVYDWLTLSTSTVAVDQLAQLGFELRSDSLEALANLPDKR